VAQTDSHGLDAKNKMHSPIQPTLLLSAPVLPSFVSLGLTDPNSLHTTTEKRFLPSQQS